MCCLWPNKAFALYAGYRGDWGNKCQSQTIDSFAVQTVVEERFFFCGYNVNRKRTEVHSKWELIISPIQKARDRIETIDLLAINKRYGLQSRELNFRRKPSELQKQSIKVLEDNPLV